MEDDNEIILIDKHGSSAHMRCCNACCNPHSIRRLAPGEWLNDELINIIPLIEAPLGVQAHLLSSFIYDYLSVGSDDSFRKLDRWVKDVPRDDSKWVFGVCKRDHWVAVAIYWEPRLIQCYDPKGKTVSKHSVEVLEVSAGALHT